MLAPFVLTLLLLWPVSLLPIGIALKSGEYFVADLIEDKIDAFLVRYEDRLYRIPVEAIARIEMFKSRPDTVLRLRLEDGTVLSGPVVRIQGDRMTLRTAAGEEDVLMTRIAERGESPEKMDSPPDVFLVPPEKAATEVAVPDPRGQVGVFVYGGGNLGEFSDTHRSIGGGGLFWEPAIATFGPGRFGLRLAYLGLPNRLPIEIGSSFLTLNFSLPGYALYFDLGLGGALVRYIRSGTQESGPAAGLGFGYQSAPAGDLVFRAGLRGEYVRSRFGAITHAGLEISGVLLY